MSVIFANNGAALVGDHIVPGAEMKVLMGLFKLERPVTVRELANDLGNAFSEASLYSLLSRLDTKRHLVKRDEVHVEVTGTMLKRVLWAPVDAVNTQLRAYFDAVESAEEHQQKLRPRP